MRRLPFAEARGNVGPMKWALHVYDPKTQTTRTVVRAYPGTTKADQGAVAIYAARDLKKPAKYILAMPHRG